MSDQSPGQPIITGQEEQAQQEQEVPAPALIPAEIRDAAARAVAAEKARGRAFREQADKEARCAGEVRAFRHATNDLWCAPAGEVQPLLPTVHAALLGACAALAEAGRLGGWDQVDHERTYDGFRVRNNRTLSRPSYDWGCKLVGRARDGLLTEALFAETWEAPGLRDAFRWLSVFIEGLSGEGAALPAAGQQPSLPAPARPQPEGAPESEAEGAAEGAGERQANLKRAGKSWQEVAKRLERLRAQGEPWTSQHKLAEQIGCSSGTINKAIRETPELRSWAKRQTAAAPRAQGLNDVVTDRTAQSREADPADDAAIREYLERDLTAEERAFFNGLSREDQLDFLDDPDKHQTILGRKP
jgi:biotin operon repressor